VAGAEVGAGVLFVLGNRAEGSSQSEPPGAGFSIVVPVWGCTELSAGLPQGAGVCLEDDADDSAGLGVEGQLHGRLQLPDQDTG
jgi:hypothetical protein